MPSLFNPAFLFQQRRFILPYIEGRVFQTLAKMGIVLRSNEKRIRAFKDIHKGKRAVIMGNGPSLNVADMEALKDEITFASNKIYLAFEQTDWRPTYYFVEDELVAKNNTETIAALQGLTSFFTVLIKPYFPGRKDIIFLPALKNPQDGERRIYQFSKDMLQGTYGGATVIYQQLQMAYYMGIREVYLIGVDFSFAVPKVTTQNSISGQIVESEGEVNHFHKDYRKPGETWTMPLLDAQIDSFTKARDTFVEAGGKVINASRKTMLEVYPRGDFDKIFGTNTEDPS